MDKPQLPRHDLEWLPSSGARSKAKKENLVRRRLDWIGFIALLLASSCGQSNTTAPPPEQLVGTWNATSVELVSMANPAVRVDLVADLGASVTLVLDADDSFTLTVAYTGDEPGGPWGMNSVVRGTWSTSDVLTLQTSPTSQWQFEAVLDGDSLTLSEADTSFDFTGDGMVEDADLGFELTRG
jgi:hypothetical protein